MKEFCDNGSEYFRCNVVMKEFCDNGSEYFRCIMNVNHIVNKAGMSGMFGVKIIKNSTKSYLCFKTLCIFWSARSVFSVVQCGKFSHTIEKCAFKISWIFVQVLESSFSKSVFAFILSIILALKIPSVVLATLSVFSASIAVG